MIQRIQSLYLLIIAILAGLTVFMPVANLINDKQHLLYMMDFRGISLVQANGELVPQTTTWLLTTFAMVFGIIALITLFSYRKRNKQIRLSVINFVFMIGYYLILAVDLWMACRSLDADFHLRSTVVLPLVAMILNYLAIGAIGKDEKLVKSMDRIR